MRVLFTREMIAENVARLGREISAFYAGKELTAVALMNGGAFFACDLVRQIDLPMWFDSLRVSSYTHDKRGSQVNFAGTLKLPVAGRHILLLDDVFDSGETIAACADYLLEQGAASVKSAVLMNKNVSGRQCRPDWAAFDAPDLYLMGFGLDSEELYRNMPCVAVAD